MRRKLQDFFLFFRYGFSLKKPLFILRAIKGYLKAYFFQTGPLHYLDIATDYSCNLRCRHCFAASLKKTQTKMTLEDYRRLAKEAMSLGVIHFSFQGGEALLDKNLFEIIKVFEPKKNYISITTNGTLLTPEIIFKLKELGVDKLNVSLDSGLSKEHDEVRGAFGVFQKAIEGIELALKGGLKVSINTVITHKNLRSLGIKKLFRWAIDKRLIINPIFACPIGRWKGNENILLTPNDVKYINNLKSFSPYLKRDIDSNWFKQGCGAVKEVLYITPYGEVLPCPFIHLSLGSLKEESLREILKEASKLTIFKLYHSQCLVAENRKFMKEYLKLIENKPLPLNYKETLRWLRR